MTSTSSASSMPSGFNNGVYTAPIQSTGLVSGLNTASIINAMLQGYEIPQQNLENQQATLNSNVSDYQQINSDLLALQSQAETLASSSGWTARQATSSDTTVATASASAGTPAGSVSFTVSQLAAANSLVSSNTVAATTDVVDTNASFLLSQGGGLLGLATLAAGSGLSLGAHTVAVTQASQAASTTGTVALGNDTSGIAVTTGTNDTINVSVGNTAYTLTLGASPSGGYSGSGLLSALKSAITAAGAGSVLTAGYDQNGNLILSTIDQGSTQSLQVTGGDALATLGLSAMSQATTGTDGIVSVDGTKTTLSTVTPGGAVSLTAGSSGTVTGSVVAASSLSQVNSSLLAVGTLTATNVSTGNGSLASVVSNINAAGTGILAAAVQTSSNQYILQLTSSTTGANADLSVDTAAFSSGLGTLKQATAGANAEIQVGGSGGYTLTSQTNTFTQLLPGLSVTALTTSTNPVTVTVSPDASTIAGSVQSLVSDANGVLSDIQKCAGYNEQTKVGGPLMGSAVLQNLTNQVLGVVAAATGSSTLGNARAAGITISNGQLSFDQSTFEAAFASNPTQVQALFTQGGSFSPAQNSYTGQVSFSYASNTTKAGSYAVVVDQSAEQATATGTALASGTVSAAEQLSVTMGTGTATYATTVGESLSSIAQGLDSAFAAQGMSISAQVVNSGTQLQLTSDAYGSAASFTVTSNNGGTSGTTGIAGSSGSLTATGVDVAGTINGVTATGVGQFLSAPSSDTTLSGLSLMVTATGISSATSLGTFTYQPGLAQQLASLSQQNADPTSGSITQTISGLQNESQGLTSQISFYGQIVAQERQSLLNEFAKMEATLGTLKNQSSSLASALTGIATQTP